MIRRWRRRRLLRKIRERRAASRWIQPAAVEFEAIKVALRAANVPVV